MLLFRVELFIGSDQIINIANLHLTAVECDIFNYRND